MNRSIRPFSIRLTLVVLMLTLSAPLISRGQDAEAEARATTEPEASHNADLAPQLGDVLESAGVSPDAETMNETNESWVDVINSPFGDSDEPDDDSIQQDQRDGIETKDTDTEDTSVEDDSTAAVDRSVESESNPTAASTASAVLIDEAADPNASPKTAPTQASSVSVTMTLDQLLRQARKSTHFKHEALYTRLAERRRLAIAMRATLEAAQQVAAYGQASTQLLRDASLDTIVSTMIADKERERLDEEQPTVAMPTSAPVNLGPPPTEANSDVATGFDMWRPVYIVTDEQGQRVGWRHASSGVRTSAYVGESLMFDDDEVAIVSVSEHMGRRNLTIDVNGQRRDVPLF